ncbi:unnamed protein product [Heterobilharzia americana]|nr:unnamed protein product [Heterobilharzia americana]
MSPRLPYDLVKAVYKMRSSHSKLTNYTCSMQTGIRIPISLQQSTMNMFMHYSCTVCMVFCILFEGLIPRSLLHINSFC